MYIDGIRYPNRSIVNISSVPVAAPPAGLLIGRQPWSEARFPSATAAVALGDVVAVAAAVDAVVVCGAKGDGVSDDTKALQGCLDAHEAVLLPKGLYRISQTLSMRPNTALVGISQTHSVIAPVSGGFVTDNASNMTGSNGNFAPLIRTASIGNTTLAFVGLVSWWHLPSIYTLDWRARGGLWRSNYETRVCECLWLENYASASPTSSSCQQQATALATAKTQVRGGGTFVNYVSDEDILFTDHRHYRHLFVGSAGAGSEPLRLYATNLEHAMSEANMEVSGATHGVEMVSLKIEGSNVILWVRDSADVSLYALGGGADAFPNSSYYPRDFELYTPTILRIERTAPYRIVNLNNGGRGNEGQPITPIPPNLFPLNKTNLRVYPWPEQLLGPIIESMWAPWPGYKVPSSMWRSVLEADGPQKTVHMTRPHEQPVLDARGGGYR
jgi:hypothetical protein